MRGAVRLGVGYLRSIISHFNDMFTVSSLEYVHFILVCYNAAHTNLSAN